VEYWLYQSAGKAKITPERIERLESIGFEWDPQRAQWNSMFDRLQIFYDENGTSEGAPCGFTSNVCSTSNNYRPRYFVLFAPITGHCKVPKGYLKDPELANWVRNQRLEYANMQRQNRSRMTQDRLERLNAIGFIWSASTASATGISRKRKSKTAGKDEQSEAKKRPSLSKRSGEGAPANNGDGLSPSSSSTSSSLRPTDTNVN